MSADYANQGRFMIIGLVKCDIRKILSAKKPLFCCILQKGEKILNVSKNAHQEKDRK